MAFAHRLCEADSLDVAQGVVILMHHTDAHTSVGQAALKCEFCRLVHLTRFAAEWEIEVQRQLSALKPEAAITGPHISSSRF